MIHRPHVHGTRVGAAVAREAGVDDAGREVAAVGIAGQATVDKDLRVEDGRGAPRLQEVGFYRPPWGRPSRRKPLLPEKVPP